jgi:hypothetical protein
LKREEKGLDDALAIDLANLEKEKQNELASKELTDTEKLQLDIKYLELRKALYEGDVVSQAKIEADIATVKTGIFNQNLKDEKSAFEQSNDEFAKIADERLGIFKQNDEDIIAAREESIKLLLELQSQLFDFGRSAISGDIESEIELKREQSDAEIAGIDERIRANEDARSRDLISLRDFNAEDKKLKAQKKQAEDNIAKEISELKTKQAIADKAFAVSQVIINTQMAASKTTGKLGIFGIPLNVLIYALGAIQVATILAQPIPKFAKGTKSAHGSMSLVGEQGPEFMFVPQYSKILTADQTKRHSSMIDAMYDNKLQEHLDKFYISPALIAQQKIFERKQQQNFANNIANSFLLNSRGLSYNDLDKIRSKGTTIRNAEELAGLIAEQIANVIPKSSYRRYN